MNNKPIPITILITLAVTVTAGITIAAAQSGVLDFVLNPNDNQVPLINGTILNNDNKTYTILITPYNGTIAVPPPVPIPVCPAGFFFNETSKVCQIEPVVTPPPVVNETQPPVVNETVPPVVVPPPVVNATTQKIIMVGDVEDSTAGNAVFNQIKTRNPDIVAVLGDLGYQSDLKWFKSTYGTFGNKVLCVVGNHEAANEDGSTSLQSETLAYCGNDYYVKKLGNTVLFGINTNGDLTKQLVGVKTLVTNADFMNGIKSVHILSHKPCLTPPNSHHPGPESSSIKTFCDGVKSSVPNTVKVFYDQAHNHVLSSSADGTYKQSGAGGKSHYTCGTSTAFPFCNNVKFGFLEYTIKADGTTTSQFIDYNGGVIN